MRFKDGVYHEPGVYFGMPEDEYHADWSLGSTDLKALLISPLEFYHRSRANPFRPPEKDTPALQYGRAIHKCVLEGREAFDKLYAPKAPAPREGALVTSEDLKRHCEFLGIAKSGTKAQMIERIRAVDKTVIIHDEDVDAYMRTVEGKTLLDDYTYAEILLAAENIRCNPDLAEAFSGGVPEVSIFYELGGVPVKARLDYLKPRAIVDLKSTRNALGMPWETAVPNFLARGNYAVQGVAYMNARRMIGHFMREKKIFGDHDPKWLKKVVSAFEFSFVFVVYAAEGAPLAMGVIFNEDEPEYEIATTKMLTAIELYREGFSKYGESRWVDPRSLERWGNLSWPMWYGT
jgi:hypothetical protein